MKDKSIEIESITWLLTVSPSTGDRRFFRRLWNPKQARKHPIEAQGSCVRFGCSIYRGRQERERGNVGSLKNAFGSKVVWKVRRTLALVMNATPIKWAPTHTFVKDTIKLIPSNWILLLYEVVKSLFCPLYFSFSFPFSRVFFVI